MIDAISPLHALAYAAPDALERMPDDLLALIAYDYALTLRPEQRVPPGDWRSFGFIAGRGFGKTLGLGVEINARVACGACRAPALMGPTVDRVRDVQVATLVATAPPWCACEPYGDGVRWANGVVAEAATAEIERPSSGSNFDLVWMTEIVRWNPNTRRAAYNDVTTACRVGPRPQYLWDTTSSGKNDVIALLLEQHEADPAAHRIVRGTMFDNPLLTRGYIVDECRKYGRGTRAYDEEILGLVFAEAAGALWRDEWITTYRAHARPIDPTVVVLGLDPALSGDATADEVGIARAARTASGDIYVEDLSGRMSPEEYASIVVRECQRDASGVVVERNHVGQHARDLIKVHARLAGMRIEVLPDPNRSFPARTPGTIFVREVVSHSSKETRAAPVAALYAAGRVHHVGTLARLEHEQATWEPGTRRSPNRLDACVFAVGELADIALSTPHDRSAEIEATAKAAARLREAIRRGGRRIRG